jgi:hypothetical protein
MRQIVRHGIELDVCPTTGGVWLDKGELEKLIALIREADREDAEFLPQARPAAAPSQSYKKYDDDDDDDWKRKSYSSSDRDYHSKKKKSKMSKLMDILDF